MVRCHLDRKVHCVRQQRLRSKHIADQSHLFRFVSREPFSAEHDFFRLAHSHNEGNDQRGSELWCDAELRKGVSELGSFRGEDHIRKIRQSDVCTSSDSHSIDSHDHRLWAVPKCLRLGCEHPVPRLLGQSSSSVSLHNLLINMDRVITLQSGSGAEGPDPCGCPDQCLHFGVSSDVLQNHEGLHLLRGGKRVKRLRFVEGRDGYAALLQKSIGDAVERMRDLGRPLRFEVGRDAAILGKPLLLQVCCEDLGVHGGEGSLVSLSSCRGHLDKL
mmetsp:Transcript_71700/g.149850  ORF Transcript_71700/g.149850 Transcript_71700/m.149850 type:complete len:273 (+) Transcript_71700:300-1118(+)